MSDLWICSADKWILFVIKTLSLPAYNWLKNLNIQYNIDSDVSDYCFGHGVGVRLCNEDPGMYDSVYGSWIVHQLLIILCYVSLGYALLCLCEEYLDMFTLTVLLFGQIYVKAGWKWISLIAGSELLSSIA